MFKGVKEIHQRDLIGQQAVDYDERVDIRRLRRERIARIQAELAKRDLGGVLLYDPINVRYATGTRFVQIFSMHTAHRYCVVPREGDVVLFTDLNQGDQHLKDLEGIKLRPAQSCNYFVSGTFNEEVAQRWGMELKVALEEMGIVNEPLGVDRLEALTAHALLEQDIKFVDGQSVLEHAHAVKTKDEIALMRQTCAIADVACCAVREALRPGVTENELYAILASTNLRFGGEHQDSKFLAAGGNTNPWYREASDRIVRTGDLVGFDTDMAGPMGYFVCMSRTYLCGDRPNSEQKEAYKLAYDIIYESIPLFRPGMTLQEIAEKSPPWPEEYKANRYAVLGHGLGMRDEWPAIYFTDRSWSGMGNYEGQLEEDMVMCVEAYAGREGAREGVKLGEAVLITANGPEVITQAPFDWRLLE
ncbi:MAG: Xaa-Pro peptidase family protein [Dehalococcoidia bacterium]